MKLILILIGLIFTTIGYSQSLDTNLNLLRIKVGEKTTTGPNNNSTPNNKINLSKSEEEPKTNSTLKNQMLSICKFQTACSTYCKKSFSRFGPVKGLFISVDRILRCDRITNATASPYRKTKDGKMIDFIEEYKN